MWYNIESYKHDKLIKDTEKNKKWYLVPLIGEDLCLDLILIKKHYI